MNKALRYAMTALLAGLVLLIGAPAASAQEGPIELEVVGDGAHNVNVLVTWKKDDNPVTEILAATLTATSADGRSFGPVPLKSSPEGQNLYHSAEPLPTGEWEVTVKATKPAKAEKKAKVVAQEIVLPADPASGTQPLRTVAASDEDGSGTLITIGIIALAVVAASAIVVTLARRSRPDMR
ncbi:hypothetical protein [Acrocarpospora phusangensis]|uniref:hypothetical protein n=1 Tax=Acrocarpospora phusangensis TaxID=1070424 RepID=UPI0019510EC8|nr:hypothetical protein [Acrocarpospora phusangensis]